MSGQSYNNVVSIRYVKAGEPMIEAVKGGFARAVAREDGFTVTLVDSVVFLSSAELRKARRKRG